MIKTVRYILLMVLSVSAVFIASAATFAEMTVAEASSLIDASHGSGTRSAKGRENPVSAGCKARRIVNVDAHDLATKVYGILDKASSGRDCVQGAKDSLDLTPRREEQYLWLDSRDGYMLNYRGLTPHVSAHARVDDKDAVQEYCYFFLFPYTAETRPAGTMAQSRFAGMLLQEMQDRDMYPGANTETDDLFDVTGDYEGRFVNVRLLDEQRDDASGRYILMFIVQPDAS